MLGLDSSYVRSVVADNLKICRYEFMKEFAKEFWTVGKFKKFWKELSKEAKSEFEGMLDFVYMAVTSDGIYKGNGCKSEVMDNDINDWYSFNPNVYRISTFLRRAKRKVKAPVTVNK